MRCAVFAPWCAALQVGQLAPSAALEAAAELLLPLLTERPDSEKPDRPDETLAATRLLLWLSKTAAAAQPATLFTGADARAIVEPLLLACFTLGGESAPLGPPLFAALSRLVQQRTRAEFALAVALGLVRSTTYAVR